MTSRPRVSIGMPAYNEERHIAKAIEGILAQDWQDLELVISDNGSRDRTPEICRSYERADPRVRFLGNDTNHGCAWNFKHVLEESGGEYFLWAGAHDVFLPRLISSCAAVLDERPDLVLAYPMTLAIDNDDVAITTTPEQGIVTAGEGVERRTLRIIRELVGCDMFCGLFRKSALDKCRQGTVCLGPDHVMLIELSLYGGIAQVPEVLLHRRENRGPGGDAHSYEDFIRKQLLRLDPTAFRGRRLRPHWRWGLEQARAVMRADVPAPVKLRLLPAAVGAFCGRWRPYLYRELFSPLTES